MKHPPQPDDDALDELLARELAARGELPPTTVGEVRAAEEQGVEFEGQLPAALRQPPSTELGGAPRSRVTADVLPAASERVVDLDAVRRTRRARAGGWSHVATFLGGVAAAAAVALALRSGDPQHPVPEPGGGPGPTASAAPSTPPEVVAVPAVRACAACCAGASCPDAKGELRSCLSGRTCVGCEAPEPTAAYQVLLANVAPTPLLGGASLGSLDLCGRAAGGEWSCVPAYSEPTTTPGPRALARLASTADLAAGLEIELRPRGTKTALGGWKDSVRLGATVLCRGLGVLLTNPKGDNLGSLAIGLADPYYVDLGRAADVAALRALRATLTFEDVTPFVTETEARDDRRYLLAAGPFDRATAERLRWALVERKVEASTVFGRDFIGSPLPMR